MKDARRVLKLGSVAVKDGRFTFTRPASSAFAASAGEPVEVGVSYAYHEASAEREECHLVLTVTLAGLPPTVADVKIGDTPVLVDSAEGFVLHPAMLPAPGRYLGNFILQGFYKRGPWLGGGTSGKADFHEQGDFTVDVR